MPEPTRARTDPDVADPPREWLVANGLGGYAAGTVPGALTRRYHGLLVSAHAPPLGRVLSLVELAVTVEPGDGGAARLGGAASASELMAADAATLEEFRLEHGLPVWLYRLGDHRIRRRVCAPHGRNTVSIEYALLEGDPVDLLIRPLLQPRGHDEPVDRAFDAPTTESVEGGLDIHCGDLPTVRIRVPPGGALFSDEPRTITGVRYAMEADRGYPAVGALWSPGTLGARLESGRPLTLLASTDPADGLPTPDHGALQGPELERRQRLIQRAGASGDPDPARLVPAADAFLFDPVGREGGAGRSVIAGYHWFTDWGRDTMISLEGLTLATGRHEEAAAILRTFARHVRDGLIPNLFPEGDDDGLYHTADATLWFFHAVHRYIRATGDVTLLRELLPTFREIVAAHIGGTRFGIGVDPADDLLRQGAPGYQLTWMDAKVDDWVVTPRRGKAVEINALWYNALRLLAGWLEETDPAAAADLAARAERTRASFNHRFWHEDGGYLYDVVDGEPDVSDGGPMDDASFRPNQLFAISLDHPVLERSRWAPVVEKVEERLLTPVGLRSLSPDHPDYRSTYAGDLRSRDAAYHQGTVWGWLIGPFIDAWLRVHPDGAKDARRHLDGLLAHLDEACVGSMSEVFDAEPPFTPRGCVAQAWTVAEVLRCLRRTTGNGSG